MSKKAAAGAGTIRKRTRVRAGKSYTYWEARVTVGRDPGTGKQIQRSFYGKTQAEVRKKVQEAALAVDNGTYKDPCSLTVAEWLSIWESEYLARVKYTTKLNYSQHIKNHLVPAFGSIRLQELSTPMIQRFYNSLTISPKTIKNVHGVLHRALQQAVKIGYLTYNPSDACELPRVEKPVTLRSR